MRTAICCDEKQEQETILALLKTNCIPLGGQFSFQLFENREDFLRVHTREPFHVVIVAFEGEKGHQTVLEVKPGPTLCIWISSDRMSSLQGYLLDVEDFLMKPFEPPRLWQAFQRCLALT